METISLLCCANRLTIELHLDVWSFHYSIRWGARNIGKGHSLKQVVFRFNSALILASGCLIGMADVLQTISTYRQVSNISGSLVDNKIVDHSDVVAAAPDGAAPTTSSFST